MNLLQAYACRVFQLRNDPLVIRHNNRTSPLSRISPLVYQQVFFFCFKRPFSSTQAEIHHLGNPILAYLSIFFWGVAPSSKSKIIEDVVRYFAWRQLFWSFLIMVDTYFALDNHYPHRVIQKLTNSDQSHEEPDGWTSFFGGYMAIPAISWMYTENHI